MKRREWRMSELAFLRSPEGRAMTAAECGARIGRTAKAVSNARATFGIPVNAGWVVRNDSATTRIRELFAAGWLDREIAADVGCSRRTIGNLRRRLGLGRQPTGGGHYGRVRAEVYKRVCAANGVRSLAEMGRIKRAIARLRPANDTKNSSQLGLAAGTDGL